MGETDKKRSEVGKFLRQLRFDHDESQEEMAAKLGVATSYISLLGGRQPVTKKLALKIIKEYNLDDASRKTFVDIITRDVVRRFWGAKE